MAVACRIAPSEVLELDAPMFDALELEAAAAARRESWTTSHELAATTAELVSAQFVAYLASHGVKGAKLPKPLQIERPDSGDSGEPASSSTSPSSSAPAKVGAASFAARFLGTVAAPAATGEV